MVETTYPCVWMATAPVSEELFDLDSVQSW